MYFAYSFSINAQREYLAMFKYENATEVAMVHDSTAGLSIKEEHSTKNETQQIKQEFHS